MLTTEDLARIFDVPVELLKTKKKSRFALVREKRREKQAIKGFKRATRKAIADYDAWVAKREKS